MSFNLTPNNEFYRKQAKEADQQRVIERINNINELRSRREDKMNVIKLMSHVESVMRACGGESKANFLDVSRNFIKIGTRIPMKVNLFPFLPDDENNPRFHKVVTEILMEMDCVEGVQWIPQQGGVILIVTMR